MPDELLSVYIVVVIEQRDNSEHSIFWKGIFFIVESKGRWPFILKKLWDGGWMHSLIIQWVYVVMRQKAVRMYSESNNPSPADWKIKWSRTEPIHDGEEHVKVDKPTIVDL